MVRRLSLLLALACAGCDSGSSPDEAFEVRIEGAVPAQASGRQVEVRVDDGQDPFDSVRVRLETRDLDLSFAVVSPFRSGSHRISQAGGQDVDVLMFLGPIRSARQLVGVEGTLDLVVSGDQISGTFAFDARQVFPLEDEGSGEVRVSGSFQGSR